MAFNPKNIKKGVQKKPRKIVIFGPPKLGKTTLATSAKDSFLIYTEDRVDHIDSEKAPGIIQSVDELNEILEWLIVGKSNGDHNYKRIVIDSLDWLEPLIHEYVCEKIGATSLQDHKDDKVNFGKGLKVEAVKGWRAFLHNCDLLRDNGFDVILIAHDQTTTVNPPDSDSYDRQVMKIDKWSLAVIEEWADVIGYYTKNIVVSTKDTNSGKTKGRAIGMGKRTLHLSGENPAFMSGNSYGFGDIEVSLADCTDIMEFILKEKI